ncbi:hypothetical protein PIB30_106888, partial [Stylosanthes scabra]|nr:hypothetical protein [Stylosanthes scabra]
RRYGKQPQNDLTCKRCGSYHPGTPCRAGLGICHSCGRAGHMSWNCAEKSKQNAGKAQQQGRVYAVTADDAAKSETLIRGKCEIGDKLAFDLHVHTPTSGTVMTRLGCREVNCSGVECQGFILLAANSLGDEQDLNQIPIVREFSE